MNSRETPTTVSACQAAFAELVRRWRGGCPQAAEELYQQFGHQILVIVRRRMDPHLRRRVDSQDIMQAVWGSFFGRPRQTDEFGTPKDLLRYLIAVARHKIMDEKRDLRQAHTAPPRAETQWQFRERVPTPSQEATAVEVWQRMLADQPEYCQRILHRLRDGCSHEEIAAEIGVDPKAIQRLLRRLARFRGLKR